MQAIIFHKQGGKKIIEIQKELRFENIETLNRPYDSNRKIDQEAVLNTNAIIVFCNSPEIEPLKIIPEIKTLKSTLPIIVLDENENMETKILARKLGADEYFTKPIVFRNITIAIKNLAAKKNGQFVSRWMRAFDLWLDLEKRSAKRKSHNILLRNKEFALLEFFIINRGKILTRNLILENVWDRNANFASNTVDVHINRLRRKLDDPFRNKLIHTVPCIGYIFEKR